MKRTPILVARVDLNGSTESPQVVVPAGLAVLAINPVTPSVDVQISFVSNGSNTRGLFFTLRAGQPLTIEVPAGDELSQFSLFLFATATVTVDILGW